MHSKEIINLAKRKSAEGKFSKKIALELYLTKSTVQYMVNNNYDRSKPGVGRPAKLTKRDAYKVKVEISILKKRK